MYGAYWQLHGSGFMWIEESCVRSKTHPILFPFPHFFPLSLPRSPFPSCDFHVSATSPTDDDVICDDRLISGNPVANWKGKDFKAMHWSHQSVRQRRFDGDQRFLWHTKMTICILSVLGWLMDF
ncbi:uncharacterized protein LOC122019614 [Zingiber officinale]|uniref:uncharacterized protein LOC122019614 n=1 Tax=Zingiber officinale TaxID=94328 RepID=UPI001C4BED0E|nr:uncharacterized protein LOC122019614 [Zingiber officinale]